MVAAERFVRDRGERRREREGDGGEGRGEGRGEREGREGGEDRQTERQNVRQLQVRGLHGLSTKQLPEATQVSKLPSSVSHDVPPILQHPSLKAADLCIHMKGISMQGDNEVSYKVGTRTYCTGSHTNVN